MTRRRLTTIGRSLPSRFFTRERITEEALGKGESENKAALPIGEQARICLKDRYWIIMMVFFFLYQFGGMIKNVSLNYFCTSMFADSMGNYTVAYGGKLQGTLAIIGAVPTALGMVIALPLANFLGSKSKAIMSGAVVAVAGGAIGMIDPHSFLVVAISFRRPGYVSVTGASGGHLRPSGVGQRSPHGRTFHDHLRFDHSRYDRTYDRRSQRGPQCS